MVPLGTIIFSHPQQEICSRPNAGLRIPVWAHWRSISGTPCLSGTLMSKSHDSPERNLSWNQLQEAGDPELVRQLKAGNDDALAVIVDRYQRLVLSVALRIVKNQCEAEDVVQTVFVDVFKNVEQFDPSRGTLKTWLLQYAYSRSINRRRYLEHRQFYSQSALDEVDPLSFSVGSVRTDGLSDREAGLLIREALGSLNAKQQSAIELVYFEGLTLDEAAQKTGETLPAIRHHYYRGLIKLREFISSSKSAHAKGAVRTDTIGLEVTNVRPRPI